MGEIARIEVCPHNLRPGDVLGVIDLVSRTLSRKKRALVIGIAIEKAATLGELVVGATEDISLTEGRSKPAGKSLKRRADRYGCEHILLRVLCVKKEKSPIFYDWPS